MHSKCVHGAFAFMTQLRFLLMADSSKFNVQRSTVTRDAVLDNEYLENHSRRPVRPTIRNSLGLSVHFSIKSLVFSICKIQTSRHGVDHACGGSGPRGAMLGRRSARLTCTC